MAGGEYMKKFLLIIVVVGFLLLSGIRASEISRGNTISNTCDKTYEKDYGASFDDISAYRYQTALYSISEDVRENPYYVTIQDSGINRDYPIGEIIWQYYITGGSDNSVKAITPIPDINDESMMSSFVQKIIMLGVLMEVLLAQVLSFGSILFIQANSGVKTN